MNKHPDRVRQAFERFPRELFLPVESRAMAGVDKPVPIGFGQTNSQPSTVRWMLEKLQVRSGDAVLDIGSGSGWTSALLRYLADAAGRVVAVERVPELLKFGQDNCRRAGVGDIEFHQAIDSIGWPDGAPYDRILISAAANAVPEGIEQQLKDGGRMVVPIASSIWVLRKRKGELQGVEYPGFAFVPLVP